MTEHNNINNNQRLRTNPVYNRRGMLIAFEGINGAGKSSIINEITSYLNAIKFRYRIYKFPDRNGYKGEQIDRYLKGESVFKHKYDMFDAFAANRLATRQNIINDLHSGMIVICDRYTLSGIAYHIPYKVNTKSGIERYQHILKHFDKTMPTPDITYLVKGNHLYLRDCQQERFHNENSNRMFEIFQTLLLNQNGDFRIIQNEIGKLNEVARFVIHDMMIRM